MVYKGCAPEATAGRVGLSRERGPVIVNIIGNYEGQAIRGLSGLQDARTGGGD